MYSRLPEVMGLALDIIGAKAASLFVTMVSRASLEVSHDVTLSLHWNNMLEKVGDESRLKEHEICVPVETTSGKHVPQRADRMASNPFGNRRYSHTE